MGDVEILVTLARDVRVQPEKVADALRDAGMTVSRISNLTHIITGQIAEDRLSMLDDIPGVEGVEASQPVRALRNQP